MHIVPLRAGRRNSGSSCEPDVIRDAGLRMT